VSGLTIAAAFGVVALSGFPLLASFGAVVAVNVMAAMICALVILPPILRAAARREHLTLTPAVPQLTADEARLHPVRDPMTSDTRRQQDRAAGLRARG